jgi:hypothetical protein
LMTAYISFCVRLTMAATCMILIKSMWCYWDWMSSPMSRAFCSIRKQGYGSGLLDSIQRKSSPSLIFSWFASHGSLSPRRARGWRSNSSCWHIATSHQHSRPPTWHQLWR